MSHTPEESIRNLRNRNRRPDRSTAPIGECWCELPTGRGGLPRLDNRQYQRDRTSCVSSHPNAHWHETEDFPECRKEDGTCGHTKRCEIIGYCHIPHQDGGDIVTSGPTTYRGRCRTMQPGDSN